MPARAPEQQSPDTSVLGDSAIKPEPIDPKKLMVSVIYHPERRTDLPTNSVHNAGQRYAYESKELPKPKFGMENVAAMQPVPVLMGKIFPPNLQEQITLFEHQQMLEQNALYRDHIKKGVIDVLLPKEVLTEEQITGTTKDYNRDEALKAVKYSADIDWLQESDRQEDRQDVREFIKARIKELQKIDDAIAAARK